MNWLVANIETWLVIVTSGIIILGAGAVLCLGVMSWGLLQRRWRVALVALILALLAGGGVYPLAFERREVTRFHGCRDNIRNLSGAVENYSEVTGTRDGDGMLATPAYPATLADLVPTYLPGLPLCPAAGADTYSPSFSSSVENGAFTVTCRGAHHRVGFSWLRDLPRYDTAEGLQPPVR